MKRLIRNLLFIIIDKWIEKTIIAFCLILFTLLFTTKNLELVLSTPIYHATALATLWFSSFILLCSSIVILFISFNFELLFLALRNTLSVKKISRINGWRPSKTVLLLKVTEPIRQWLP